MSINKKQNVLPLSCYHDLYLSSNMPVSRGHRLVRVKLNSLYDQHKQKHK